MRLIAAVALLLIWGGYAMAQDAMPASSADVITNIKAVARNGQVFITWDEAELPEALT